MFPDDQWWARSKLISRFNAEIILGFLGILVAGLPLFLSVALSFAKALLISRVLDPNTVETWFFLPMMMVAVCLTMGLSSWWIENTCRRWVQRHRLDVSSAVLSVPFINLWVVGGKLSRINIRPPSSRR